MELSTKTLGARDRWAHGGGWPGAPGGV